MQPAKRSFLVLEDGTVFRGYSMGAEGVALGEVVFNTCTASYQDLLSDPTYYGQIVAQTYPLVGNRGVNGQIGQSRIMANGYISREWCNTPTFLEGNLTLDEYLKLCGIVGLWGIDTRRLTRVLRNKAYIKGAITNTLDDMDNLLDQIRQYSISGAVKEVTVKEKERIASSDGKYEVAIMDYGFSHDFLKHFVKRGVNFTLYPAFTPSDEVLSTNPDGIYLSDGPGDPDDNPLIIENIKALSASGKPIYGIGLGHQMLALALGGKIEKMEKGHRGSNQPVRNLDNGKIMITTQNHGYAVEKGSLPEAVATVIMENVNDRTIEGLRYNKINAYTVQFEPTDGNGFQDTAFIFDKYVEMVKEAVKNA